MDPQSRLEGLFTFFRRQFGGEEKKAEEKKAEYLITVVTGNKAGAGTDASASVVIKGTDGETDSLKLGCFKVEGELTTDIGDPQKLRPAEIAVARLVKVKQGIKKRVRSIGNSSWILRALFLRLFRWFQFDVFAPGQIHDFRVTARDVGEPLLVMLKKDGGSFDPDWFVDRLTIKKVGTSPGIIHDFPCNRWVQNGSVTIFEGKAKLPNHEQHEIVKREREIEISQRQSLFKWGRNPAYSDLPGFLKALDVKELPKDVQFTDEAVYSLFGAGAYVFLNKILLWLMNFVYGILGLHWKHFDDFRKLFYTIGSVPKAANYWQEDRFYGFQFLNGCNPESIKRCTKLPSNFPVTQELVGNLLDEGDTLMEAMEEGRIYIVDYKILEDIPKYGHEEQGTERRYACASLGLFYVKDNKNLVPIAIQLHQQPGADNPIWTPNDEKYDWLCAKMWLRNSDAQFHQMITHLLRTHLFMEPVSIASLRQLPTIHPLWKLLSPHIRGVLAINTLGRSVLIAEGGVADNTLSIGGKDQGHILLMQKYYKNISWTTYNLPQALKKRGIDVVDKLPNFYYRDDSLKLWTAIEKFVRQILAIYYRSDDDVIEDDELQLWVKDLHDNGYAVTTGHADHGVPHSFKNFQEVCDFLTAIIFTCSCQHAAVNFSQLDTYGFPPNAPALMRQKPPTKKGEVTEENLMKCLPTQHQAEKAISAVYDLTRIFPDEKLIGDYPERLFTDAEAEDAIFEFQMELKRISNGIEKRNASLEEQYRYFYLHPERVPNSIAI